MVAVVMRKVISGAVFGAILLGYWPQSFAALPVRNQNPFVQFVGIPSIADAQKLNNGQYQLDIDTTLSSHFVMRDKGNESVMIDGESYVGDITWRQGFKQFELSVTVPLISFQGGVMDSFIQDFHQMFGLPNGDRGKVKDDQFYYGYQGEKHDELDNEVSGLGDIRIAAGLQMVKQRHYQHALHAMIKLPTGDHDKWLGSGATDLSFYSTHRWFYDAWRFEAQVGAIIMDKPEVLRSQRRPLGVFAGASVGYELFPDLFAIVQWDGHTGLYKGTTMTVLGDGHVLTGGIEWRQPHWRLQMALLEDIKVDSAPDVGFLISFRLGGN